MYICYYTGDALDLSGAAIRISYSNGQQEIVSVTSDMISGFDSATIGAKTVTVAFGGFTTTFNVTVRKMSSGGGTGGNSPSADIP